MFAVIFEVRPRPEQWDAYLGNAKMLRPELEAVDGFIDNIRYRSLTREGWILSLSSWRDEKSVVRWRTHMRHHKVQEQGRGEILADYHLRVGQLTRDTRIPQGQELREQRLDETEIGDATTALLIDAKLSKEFVAKADASTVAQRLGPAVDARGLVAWDVFDAILEPGAVILLSFWRNQEAAERCERSLPLANDARLRRVRIVRDYSMFDRREAPQYYPEIIRLDSETA